ncbi:glycoside hydrolase family 31 protein [Mycena albidolilacea]|uniref:Glucosidase II subunit alpha n=1 Tax=Mycena albidolilacea TaxID=1033008 RepID=A0AAD7A6U3_9AGAR|nr:glycoside hydrolase family 31 protein [Mycena albidolilacea]
MQPWTLVGVLSLLLAVPDALAVKSHDFKTCSQAGFCRRGRALSARAAETKAWKSPYSVDVSSIAITPDKAVFTAGVHSSLYPDIHFGLELRVHEDGVVRVRLDEVNGLRKRYDEAASWALIAEPKISQDITWTAGKKDIRAKYGNNEVVVAFEPLTVSLLRGGKPQVVLNGRGLLHMEHFRNKKVEETKTEEAAPAPEEGAEDAAEQVVLQAEAEPEVNPRAWFEGETEDDWWEERFSTWTDSKPKGPESLSIDISFPSHGTIYGIPQHATRLALPTTAGDSPTFTDPYRLYNADVFEYLASSPMSLYGSIPVLHAHSADSTVGIFHAVGSETWIDVSHASDKSTETHWISESGILDLFLMPGPTPADIFAQYSRLTGTPVLPPHWSLGYHQCRWNYISSEDIRTVQKRFDEEDMPVDVFWLDIEYADEHKYFMWDEKNFPDPVEMTNDVAANGRKMVVIVDPHLKRTSNYPAFQEASDRKVLVKQPNGEGEYEGWCWSGSSSWIDFFDPNSWDWWKGLFKTTALKSGWSWTSSTTDIHIWNDMNEPSVFNGPEISMPRDNIHYGGWEHRDVHNINGMLFSNLSSKAVQERTDPPQRPFVLTRSFFAGSQRFGAMWTGDNLGTWEHMAVGVQMVLANGIAGMSFAGSDVGGFFGNPEPEMLIRWYQVGIFNPFLRAHAHIDTKRREPFLLEQPYKGIVKDLLRLRYTMLPVWYTAFRETSVTGVPVLRPHYVVFPKDPKGFAVDDQYFIGASGILVKPITTKGATETTVYLAEDEVYYDYFSHHVYRGAAKGKEISVKAELHQVPVFVRGGSIVPTRERPRRSSPLMKLDPFTLRVALSKAGSARGELYLDDGVTYSHEKGQFVWREFTAQTAKKTVRITTKDLGAEKKEEAVDGVALASYNPTNVYAETIKDVRVEKIVVEGLSGKPASVKVEGGKELVWEYAPGIAAGGKGEGVAGVLTIKDPKVLVVKDWTIVIQL